MNENDYEDAFIDPPFDPEDFVRAGGAEIAKPDEDDEFGAYGMFSIAGGVMVDQIVKMVGEDVARQQQRKSDLLASIRSMSRIVAWEHPEVGDTDVREQVYDTISDMYRGVGVDKPFTYDEFWDVWA